MIEGLTKIEGPMLQADRHEGPLVLPAWFDTKKNIARWVKDGPLVDKAKEETRLYSAGVVARGWQVALGPKKEVCTRICGRDKYVLMFRPKNLQRAINKIYANESRSRVHNELNHNSVSLSEGSGGMISEDQLKAVRRFEDSGDSPNLPLHSIDVEKETTIQTQEIE